MKSCAYANGGCGSAKFVVFVDDVRKDGSGGGSGGGGGGGVGVGCAAVVMAYWYDGAKEY